MENGKLPFYKEALAKPLEEITADLFLRPEAFGDAPWYGQFLIYTRIGVCQPAEEHVTEVRKALKMMGYDTRTASRDGKTYVVPL